MTDWAAVREAYEGTTAPLRTIANVHGIKSENSIRDRAKRGGWLRKPVAQAVAQVAQPAQIDAATPDAKARPIDGEVMPRENRDEAGRFLKGASGNPGGRPANMPEITRLAREKTPQVVKGLFEFATSNKNPGAARVRAYELLAELGWGKTPATLVIADARGEGEARDRASIMDELEAMFEGLATARAHDETRAAAEEAVPA